MKITLPHFHTPIHHFGYKGFVGHNPNIEIVQTLHDADFVWYHTVGDSHEVNEDLGRISNLNKRVIAIITGDKAPDFVPYGYIFGTNCGFNVPYEYDRFIPYYLQGTYDLRRTQRISFRGHRQTWKNRHRMQVPGIQLTWIDWWKTDPSRRPQLMEGYVTELKNSVFSLCPRGNGPSSMRLFESMLLGAIPVRLDDWTKPFGQELDFSPRFDLDTVNMNDIVKYLQNMTESEIKQRVEAMRDFVEKYLVIDARRGCEGTMGYSEWIREFITI